MRLGLGLGLSRGAGAGGPLNLVAPAVTGSLTNGSTLTSTTGTWTGLPSYTYQWKRDGADISGQTASTYTYATATDDGRYITCTVTATNLLGSGSATSNAVIAGENAVVYSTSFAGTDGTQLNGFESWDSVNAAGATSLTSLRILSNDLAIHSNSGTDVYRKNSGFNDHIAKLTITRLAGDTTGSSLRTLVARCGANSQNLVYLSIQSNGWQFQRRVAGANTSLSGFIARTLADGDIFEIRNQGIYAQVWINGSHTSQSVAQNSGLGWDVSAVSAATYTGLRAEATVGGSQPAYPFAYAKAFEVQQFLADSITINTTTVELVDTTPGRQRIRLVGTEAGTGVTQLQALVLSSTGRVVLDWADVSGLSGGSFDVVTAELPQSVEGSTVTVWLRDKTNKKTASSVSIAVPVNAEVVSLTVGVNAAKTGLTGSAAADLMRMAALKVLQNSLFRDVFKPECTVSGSTAYVDAADIAIDSNYFPTQFPSGGSYVGTDYPFYFINAQDGLPSYVHGVYDVEFTPGLRWTLNNNGTAITRSNYNEAAGTATLTVTGATGSNPEIRFSGYDNGGGYVARTLPAAGVGYFRAIKQGQPAGKRFLSQTITSLGGVTSSGGFIRFMEAAGTNRGAFAGVTYNSKTARRPATAVGLVSEGETMSLEDMLEICTDNGSNPWICIGDTATSGYVTDVAQYLFDNMPVGMKVAVEYSNEVWNFGPGFTQSTAVNDRATAAGVTNRVQYSREYKTNVLDPFEAVFGVNNPRLHPMFSWQTSLTYSDMVSMLDENNIYQKIKGFAIAPYIGDGVGGTANDLGDYNQQTIFSKASRDLILTDAAAFKTAFFAAQATMSIAARNVWINFVNMLAQYCVAKGLSRTAIRPAAYEYFWHHILEANTPTAGGQDVLTKAAFAEILRDSRAGDAQDAQHAWFKASGGDLAAFKHLGAPGTSLASFGSWGYYDNVGDTTSEPGVSTVAWVTANT